MSPNRALPRWLRPALFLSVSLVLLGAIGLLWLGGAPGTAAALPRFGTVPDFRLVDHEGREVTRADFTGKVLVVGFIYTSCPDICPMVTSQMKGLQDDLRTAGLLGEVQLVSISVDPERDTPEKLAAYAAGYGADTGSWRFLTGDLARIKLLVEEGFLVGMNKTTDPHAGHNHGAASPAASVPYEVSHSGRIVLVDGAGGLRAYHEGDSLDPAAVLADVKRILQGG